ncbi:tetratricopeptide repeat protein [Micromonospora sp. NPDC048894]|uniref:tetratricopeptide repeat protein n=1 Tax=Micromonospora sp. NPDC048894 TaxID=3155493 RepID=UPI0033F8F6D5
MATPRKYTSDVIADAVRQVESARATGRRGPISTVARELRLDRRLLQRWVSKARAAAATAAPHAAPRTDVTNDPAVLPDGLLHCRFCQQPMTPLFTHVGLVYDCPPPCPRTPLNATAVAHVVGQVVLRHAAHLLPAPTHPKRASIAAAHAHRFMARITAGAHPTDLHITWPATASQPRHALTEVLRLAHQLVNTDPTRTHHIVQRILADVDPATTATSTLHAEAAHLLARLLHSKAAIRWADFAHRSLTHLHGPTAPTTLTAAHTLATAHRRAGHHQRAYRLYRQLADHLAATAGPDAHPTLAVQATTALVLDDLGHREAARTLLADTITHHRRAHPGHPATSRMAEHLDQLQNRTACHNSGPAASARLPASVQA